MRHYITTLPIALASILLLTSVQAKAHEGDPNVVIHVFQNGETYENCSFMIHPSLTQGEFHRFTREAGGIVYFQPLTGASTLGKYKFNVGLAMSKTPIDQTAGAWNNTFAHPITEADETPHFLGDQINIPNVRVAMGISDHIDLGVYATKDFTANYGFVGLDVKYGREIKGTKDIYIAARASHAMMFGPKDLSLSNTAADLLISKKCKVFEPYAGVSAGLSRSKEKTDKVQLNTENVFMPRALVGAKLEYKFISTAIEYDLFAIQSFSFKLGARF